ncbi:MAG: hypothetical protein WCK65_03930 [Rhodospirillaceae bacterium]
MVQDAELGRRYVDKLVRVTLLGGEERWILVHIKVQGTRDAGFAERMFVYNYRLFDRFRRPVASLAVLADDIPVWKPSSFGLDALSCEHRFKFPTFKLLRFVLERQHILCHDAFAPLMMTPSLQTQFISLICQGQRGNSPFFDPGSWTPVSAYQLTSAPWYAPLRPPVAAIGNC